MVPKKKVVIAIHGIETQGIWEMELAPIISEQGWIYYPLHYGRFPFYKLTIPKYQMKMINWFRDKYNQIRNRHQEVIPSVIAHSFGTRIVSGSIAKYPGIKFDKIILCGSIVKRDYNWIHVFKGKQATGVKNDYGGKDFWTGFPLIFVRHTGPSGKYGFENNHSKLYQKKFDEYTHSSAFGLEHYENEWINFLRNPLTYEGEEMPPNEFEEPVSPLDAARWSAITYFHQFVRPVIQLINTSGDANERKKNLTVLLPKTPGEAQRDMVTCKYQDLKATEIALKAADRNINLHIIQDMIYIDIPTILNSLIYLDHRTNEELVVAVDEFAETLNQQISSPKYGCSGKVSVIQVEEFQNSLGKIY